MSDVRWRYIKPEDPYMVEKLISLHFGAYFLRVIFFDQSHRVRQTIAYIRVLSRHEDLLRVVLRSKTALRRMEKKAA
jgi:hypothetical protein